MNLDRVPSGKDVPNDCNVIIEIPMLGDPIKYEVDKETGALFVDRFMSTADALSVQLRLCPAHPFGRRRSQRRAGVVAHAADNGRGRALPAVGMLKMEDEAGGDSKVLAVPIDKLSGLYHSIQSPRDLPEITTRQIAHFFEHYKDLEPGKWVRVSTWVGAEEAKAEIVASVERFRATHKS